MVIRMDGAVALIGRMKTAVLTIAPSSLPDTKPVVIRTVVRHRQGYGGD
jgi:hypothetical protein